MHPIVFRAALTFMLVVKATVLLATGQDDTRPILVIDTPHKQFNDVMRGAVINESFTIKNAGNAPLRVEGVEMSHPSMKIRVKQVIQPGEEVAARIEWDTQSIAGDLQGVAVLQTNDPLHPRAELLLQGKVIPPIQILPRPVFYLSQFQGEQSITEFIIQNNQDKAIQIDRLERLGEHFNAKVETKTEGKVWGLVVSVPADTPVGRFHEALRIYTNDPENKSIHIQVNIMVKPDVFINPDAIEFGKISLARIRSNPELLEFLTQTLVINRRQGTMTIEKIKSPVPFIEVSLIPDGSSDAFQLNVKLSRELLETGRFEDQITLVTDDPKHAEIGIPVSGEVID